MLLEAETNKYCPGGYDIGAMSNLITWVLNFFLSVCVEYVVCDESLKNWYKKSQNFSKYPEFCIDWHRKMAGKMSYNFAKLGPFLNGIRNPKNIRNIRNFENAKCHKHPTPTPSQRRTVCIYCTLTQEGGRVEPERKLEGQQFIKLGRKYQQQHCK